MAQRSTRVSAGDEVSNPSVAARIRQRRSECMPSEYEKAHDVKMLRAYASCRHTFYLEGKREAALSPTCMHVGSRPLRCEMACERYHTAGGIGRGVGKLAVASPLSSPHHDPRIEQASHKGTEGITKQEGITR